MRNGLIYVVIDWILEKLKYLNLVELFKYIAKKLYRKDKILASRAGVDLFILFKWMAIIVIWSCGIKNELVNIFIWYLIITNIYTYFYYHTWTKDLSRAYFDLDRIKRRFLNLVLAIGFNVICFAYFFAQPFSSNFQWKDQISSTKDAILFSLANSLTANYDSVHSLTQVGQTLTLMETFISFVFLVIILSNSIPQTKES